MRFPSPRKKSQFLCAVAFHNKMFATLISSRISLCELINNKIGNPNNVERVKYFHSAKLGWIHIVFALKRIFLKYVTVKLMDYYETLSVSADAPINTTDF